MAAVFEMIERAAEVHVPVLIVGETGTGKELVAQEIHARSLRKNAPFVAVNTGALSEELVASELFGHMKGAFTGASNDYGGRFLEAAGGSLFLDEIATMSERIQIVFLRVLEDGMYRPVGGHEDKRADARIIAATNADLRRAVEAGLFREDLLQRFMVFRIILPPLREHLEDLPLLSAHFLEQAGRELDIAVSEVSPEALEILERYPWPGNIRELKNAIAQAGIMARGSVILPEHIPPRIKSLEAGVSGGGDASIASPPVSTMEDVTLSEVAQRVAEEADSLVVPLGLSLDAVERAYVTKTLAACGGNKTRAAASLGVSRKTLREWLVRWDTQARPK